MEKSKKVESLNVPWLEVVSLLSNLVVFKHSTFDEFLQKLIQIVIKVIPVDACLIYFYDKAQKELTLVASKKSHNELLGNITLKKGEGITGWVVEHNKAVAIEKEAYKDSRFKPFKELPEDKYEAFLSVPIVDENGIIGVINLHCRRPYLFSNQQIETI